eukprot:COSAG02_NODE_206_length_29144_cov_12.855121_12_plen_84_part_00
MGTRTDEKNSDTVATVPSSPSGRVPGLTPRLSSSLDSIKSSSESESKPRDELLYRPPVRPTATISRLIAHSSNRAAERARANS